MIEWLVFLLAVVPFIELRGAVPLAIGIGHDWVIVLVGCVLLNLLVIPIAFILLDFILPPIRKRVDLVERLFRWATKRVHKHQNMGLIGLTLFVGVPLPVTGAYTGSLIAYIAGLERKRAALAIGAGITIAGMLVWTLTVTGIRLIPGL